MLSLIIIISVIILSLLITKKYKISGFVALIALMGSDTDSAGILYGISSFLPGYKFIIRGLVFGIFIYAIYRLVQLQLSNDINQKFLFWYGYPILITTIIIFLISIYRGQGVLVALSEIIWLGTPFFLIWSIGSLKNNNEKLFSILIISQAIISIIILISGPLTSLINGASYAYIIGGDAWVLDPNLIINANLSFGDFNKHSIEVFKFAQYHNPNSLGVYSAAIMGMSIYFYMKKENPNNIWMYKMISFALMVIGILGWFNSLTRGPIIMMGVVLLFYILGIVIYPKTYKRIFLFIVFIITIALATTNILKIFDYLLVDENNISVLTRLDGYIFAINAIITNPFWGVEPTLNDPVPHLLPLKIAAYYGLPASLLLTIPILHVTVINFKLFLNRIFNGTSEKSLFPLLLNAIVLGAMLTNGIVVYVLFWVILAEVTTKVGVGIKKEE